jgi:hypothetical protein
MKTQELQQIIREEIRKMLNEAQSPSYKSKYKNNNLVAAIYFSWTKNDNNNQSLWAEVIKTIEENDCVLIKYVVTDSVCEFEFKPDTAGISQDLLEEIKFEVKDSLKPIVSSKATGYDVYIVGN